MIGEIMILAMLLCVGLTIMAYVMRMWPVAFISSMGWVIISLRLFEEYGDMLISSLVIMFAISQIIMIRDKEAA